MPGYAVVEGDTNLPAKRRNPSPGSSKSTRDPNSKSPHRDRPGDEPTAELWARLRTYREQQGLSLSGLSELTGLSKGYLSSLENHDQPRRPSAEVLYTLAQALGVTMSDLMGRRLLSAAAPDVPPSLAEFANDAQLNEADIAMLASIQFRGEQPRTPARWRYIYESIRNSKQMDSQKP
jgi:transcriptional regulator with XRE-family HTH domain